jgi:hypothetical protein
MKTNQLTRGGKTRLMYIECKSGLIDGVSARIGWVTFSKSGRSVYYRGRSLGRMKGGGISGNYIDADTGEEFWISGVKQKGSNVHPAEQGITVAVDEDASEALEQLRRGAASAS